MQPAATVDLTKSQRLSDLIRRPISSRLVQYVAQQAGLVIPCHTTTSRRKKNNDDNEEEEEEEETTQLPPLPIFIQSLIKRSCVKPGTILGALVFLDRLQRRLAHLAKGMPCTCHRIFLATLIVTSKSLHDTSPKNKHWARYAVHFNLSEINLMEQQLLSLMNYQLIITPEEIDIVFIQYELYKSQHQRHQQILPPPTTIKYNAPPPPPPPQPILPAPNNTNVICAQQQQQTKPATMEPRYMDLMVNDTIPTNRKTCDPNDMLDHHHQQQQQQRQAKTTTGSYPHTRLFPMASLSSTSLSSGCSSLSYSSLRTPSSSANVSLTSLNLSSSSSLRTPYSSSLSSSSSLECITLPPLSVPSHPQAHSLPTTITSISQLEQDPVLFYPPAHVHHRDTYHHSSSTTSNAATWNNTGWQKPAVPPAAAAVPPPAPPSLPPVPTATTTLLDASLLSQDPTIIMDQQQQQQQQLFWTTSTSTTSNPHPL